MTFRKWIGVAILCALAAGIVVAVGITHGWVNTLLSFGVAIVIAVIAMLAVHLVVDDK